MGALRRLGQLLGVAEQDEVSRRAGDGRHVGERHLPRLVDEQDVECAVELLAGEEPRCARDHVDGAGRERLVDDLVGLGGADAR